jgi:hypothetical protein
VLLLKLYPGSQTPQMLPFDRELNASRKTAAAWAARRVRGFQNLFHPRAQTDLPHAASTRDELIYDYTKQDEQTPYCLGLGMTLDLRALDRAVRRAAPETCCLLYGDGTLRIYIPRKRVSRDRMWSLAGRWIGLVVLTWVFYMLWNEWFPDHSLPWLLFVGR